jgi:hypothetical protein
MANTASRTAKYSSFLGSQESAVFHYAKSASNDLGSVWYAPNAGGMSFSSHCQCAILHTELGSIFKPQSQTSGIAALVAAAKVSHELSS